MLNRAKLLIQLIAALERAIGFLLHKTKSCKGIIRRFLSLQGLGEPLVVQFWHPHDPLFDPNLVIIWILACFCVAVGSFWSGVTTQNRYYNVSEHPLFMEYVVSQGILYLNCT